METDAFLRYCKSILDWLLAICHEWITLACGGIVMAVWFGISTYWRLSMNPQQFISIAVLFVLAGSFKAWKRERDKVLALESTKRDAALVPLRNFMAAATKRLLELKAADSHWYTRVKDTETTNLLNTIGAYIYSHLKPNALEVFRANYEHIYAIDLLPNGYTMYEGEMAVSQEGLRRIIKNLQALISDMDTYLL